MMTRHFLTMDPSPFSCLAQSRCWPPLLPPFPPASPIWRPALCSLGTASTAPLTCKPSTIEQETLHQQDITDQEIGCAERLPEQGLTVAKVTNTMTPVQPSCLNLAASITPSPTSLVTHSTCKLSTRICTSAWSTSRHQFADTIQTAAMRPHPSKAHVHSGPGMAHLANRRSELEALLKGLGR